jgi:NitT/TauT family transport system permease protein
MKNPGFIRLLVIVGTILLIECLCRTGVIPKSVFIAPSAMFVQAVLILKTGKFSSDILVTIGEIVSASIGSILGGFVIGLILHARPAARKSIEPLLSSYYAVPTFIFYPVFIVVFGAGSTPIIAIALLLGIVAMITATINGIDRIPRSLHKTAKVLRLSPMRAALHVQLPAALPYIFSGVKLAIAYSFIGVIASEFILSGKGIGYAIAYAYNNFQNQDMYGLMLIVLVLVTLVNAVLNKIDRHYQSRRQR